MRDPNRISEILQKLGDVWTRNPDLRLGQIIVNATMIAKQGAVDDRDVFYIKDEDLLMGLEPQE